jgi:hypothetical protein
VSCSELCSIDISFTTCALCAVCVCFFAFHGSTSFYGIRSESSADKRLLSPAFKVGSLEYSFLCRKNLEEGLRKPLAEP